MVEMTFQLYETQLNPVYKIVNITMKNLTNSTYYSDITNLTLDASNLTNSNLFYIKLRFKRKANF